MTDPYRTPDPVRARALRELAGLLLLLAGLAGLLVVLWTVDARLAWGALATGSALLGWRLATGGDTADDDVEG